MGHPPNHSGAAIASARIEAYETVDLVLTSDGIGADGRLDRRFAAEGDDISPPLSWTRVADAQSYVLIVEDPDAPRDIPPVHWMIWDIPIEVGAIPENLPKTALPGHGLGGAIQGDNSHGEPGWMGMAPPVGHGPHRYHFQLFAVGKMLNMPPHTTLEALVSALKGATVAKSVLVGTYEREAEPAQRGEPRRDEDRPDA